MVVDDGMALEGVAGSARPAAAGTHEAFASWRVRRWRHGSGRRTAAVVALVAALAIAATGCSGLGLSSGGSPTPSRPAVPSAVPSGPAPAPTTTLDDVVPEPVSIVPKAGARFQITAPTIVWVAAGCGAAGRNVAGQLADTLRRSTGFRLPVYVISGTNPLIGIDLLCAGAPGSVGAAGYQLDVTGQRLVLRADDGEGLFDAVQTLRQVLPAKVESPRPVAGPWVVPGGQIIDYPRYAYRGAMLDVARHFFTVAQVERYIDEISLYKIDVLHLHLTDDQGWRIAMNGLPRLTSVGGSSSVGDDRPGFYTQAQYRQIVAYAAAHYVTVVPEIDMPSHTNAAIASYGYLNCDGHASSLYTGVAVGFIALCTDKQSTYTFVSDVLRQMSELTPGPYLHVGGDESKTLSKAQYTSFFARVQPIIAADHKTAIAWDELAPADPAPSTILEYYEPTDQDPALVADAENGTKVIMAPANHAYLDQKYDDATPYGYNWAGNVPVSRSYDWDPATEVNGLPASSVIGVEACQWSETITSTAALEYMSFPRLPAIAEIGWSPAATHDWSDFRVRLAAQGPRWTIMGVNFYHSPEIPWPAS